ncbi:hypothetical protein [Nocardioides sp. Root190]|uniref:hypothetical protein n=1 Tax=Nocardioides sp. Root190 TaxID=1736488 RepID=UPI000A875303|nr:hypothetical protein [Nocardioides sp. Root190]
MKRLLVVLAALAAGLLPFLAQPSTAAPLAAAKAPAPISGRVFSGGVPAAGLKIELRSGPPGRSSAPPRPTARGGSTSPGPVRGRAAGRT